jgi:hypothetical protein
MARTTARWTAVAGVVVALAALTGCSGGGGGASSADAGGSLAAPEPAPQDEDGRAVGDTGTANRAAVQTRAVIRTGELFLTSKDLDGLRADVEDLLEANGGTIDKEESSNDRDGKAEQSTLVLRVPVGSFAAVKKSLEGLGKLRSSDESAKDVTTEVIDVDERVQTLQNSLDNLQRFQQRAKDVTELLRFEDQITARQSELQSLKAQQSYLRDQTSMSTITVHLSTPDEFVPPPDALENAGFLAGFKAGWHALGDFVVVLLTAFGAALPFLVAGAVVGVPAWLALRELLRRRRVAAATTAPLPDSP